MRIYLAQTEQKYLDTLHSEQFKEYRERIFQHTKQEKENAAKSMNGWKKVMGNTNKSSGGSNKQGTVCRSTEQDREDETETAWIKM